MWASTLLSPYLHPKLSSLYSKLCKSPCQCGVYIGLYALSSRRGLCMGCCITKGVTERCIARLHLTIWIDNFVLYNILGKEDDVDIKEEVRTQGQETTKDPSE